MNRCIQLLTYTSLYPNAVTPNHGVFVENRIRKLVASGEVETVVIAPVPWFPFKSPVFGTYAGFASVPKVEERHGIKIHHPRYPLIPKIGMSLTPFLMALATRSCLKMLVASGHSFDVIDAHYFYPDGVAACILGKWLDKPVVITARGTDLNLIPTFLGPRRQIIWAAKRSEGLITVCQALKDVLVRMAVPDNKITVLRNGVNLDLFRLPENRLALREHLGISKPTLLSVGHLIRRKGHHLAIDALTRIPKAELLIIGTGPEKEHLLEQTRSCQLESRIRFIDPVPHEQLHRYYGAADALILASSREGWPNVVLESMACGTPVVATEAWGTPEILAGAPYAQLVPIDDVNGLSLACESLLKTAVDREMVRKYAERFSWHETSQGQIDLFDRIVGNESF